MYVCLCGVCGVYADKNKSERSIKQSLQQMIKILINVERFILITLSVINNYHELYLFLLLERHVKKSYVIREDLVKSCLGISENCCTQIQ